MIVRLFSTSLVVDLIMFLFSALFYFFFFFFSSRRRHTRFDCDWSSDVCSSDLSGQPLLGVLVVLEVDVPGEVDRTGSDRDLDRLLGVLGRDLVQIDESNRAEIGRASCRERV